MDVNINGADINDQNIRYIYIYEKIIFGIMSSGIEILTTC